MKRCLTLCFVGMMVFCAISLIAQAPAPAPAQTAPGGGESLTPQQLNARAKAYNAPQIPYDSVANFIKLPTGRGVSASCSASHRCAPTS